MYIYGLDVSLTNTGVAIFNEDGLLLDKFSINTEHKRFKKMDKDMVQSAKLNHHYNEINKIIKKYPPKLCVTEAGFSRHNKTTQILFKVHGVYTLAFPNVPIVSYSPSSVKKTIYKGNANKEDLQRVLRKRLNKKFHDYDQSDAVCVGLTYFIKKGIVEWSPVIEPTTKDLIKYEKQIEKENTDELLKVSQELKNRRARELRYHREVLKLKKEERKKE